MPRGELVSTSVDSWRLVLNRLIFGLRTSLEREYDITTHLSAVVRTVSLETKCISVWRKCSQRTDMPRGAADGESSHRIRISNDLPHVFKTTLVPAVQLITGHKILENTGVQFWLSPLKFCPMRKTSIWWPQWGNRIWNRLVLENAARRVGLRVNQTKTNYMLANHPTSEINVIFVANTL